MLRFDAYTATSMDATPDDFCQILADAGGLASVLDARRGKGFHQFAHRVGFRDHTGTEWASVQWGGARHEGRTMIEVKGENTPAAAELLRQRFYHRVTRVDSCADFDKPRAFESLYRKCRQVKKAHRIVGGKHGDWEDFPEKGRTLYLGAKSSVTRMRLYEKGLQPEYAHLNRPNWSRMEVQVRPAKEAKDAFNRLTPAEVWGASRWTRELAAIALQSHIDPHPAGTTYRLSSLERRTNSLCKQYGATFMELYELSGDDWAAVGEHIGRHIEAMKRHG